jgi:hypothetical protein
MVASIQLSTEASCDQASALWFRKRVIGIMAAILASTHMRTADDLFGTPQGSPRTDKLIAASVQWAERMMDKIDERFSKRETR